MRLELPDGRVLLGSASERFAPGESLLVTGPSGVGKSTLFRAIAGIWPFGGGRITIPRNARVLFLLRKPDWLMMDEATSALDAVSEERLYRLLKDQLPHTTIISIGHRPALAMFHERKFEFQPAETGEGMMVAPAGT